MSDEEISKEIMTDWVAIKRTINRKVKEYTRSRLVKKIQKERSYCRYYSIKSKKKNDWIIFIMKADGLNRYKNDSSASYLSIVYYYNDIGLRVFAFNEPNNFSVYNGHFFRRYQERANLNISDPIKLVKHFFIENPSMYSDNENSSNLFAICREEILLGGIDSSGWFVFKTFISQNESFAFQNDKGEFMLDLLQNKVDSDENNTKDLDILKGIQTKKSSE